MDSEDHKRSQRSAQSPPDHENELLTDFVQAVENEYCRQNNTPQSLKWSSLEPLVKRLRNLDNTSIRESQQKIFFEYLLQYLEISLCFISSFEDSEYKKQKNYATVLLGFVPNFFKEVDVKNAFIAQATAKVLDLFMFGDFSTVSKTVLLRMFNEIATQSTKQVRTDTAETIDYYMYKLIDSLSTYGDYMIQCDTMETLFRIFGSQIRNSRIQYELLPGSEELGKSLVSDISIKNFDNDVRRWLNKFNSDSQFIFSLPCKTLMFGNTVCERLDDNLGVTWVDFNMKENMISFYSGDSVSDQWNRIIILAKDVKKVEVNRQFTSTENTTVFMHLSKPCISDLFDRQEYWNSLDRHFKIIISSEEKEKITKLISQVLPRLFGDTFSHSSARISGRLKPVYKPLKISKKRSSPSDLSSVSSKSKSDAVQQGQSRHSSVRVTSPSVSGSNAYKPLAVEIKQSDVRLDLVEDNISEVVTDFTRCSSRRSGITSGRASLLTSPDSDMFMSVSPTSDIIGRFRSFQEIEKIQDNIVTSSHGADDETLTSPRIEILSGQSSGSRPVSMHGIVSEFRPSEQFSSTPVKISRQIISDEFLGDVETVEHLQPSNAKEKEAPAAQKISTFLGDVETVEQLESLDANEQEAPVAQKISTFLGDVETGAQLKPLDRNENEAHQISALKAAENVDKDPRMKQVDDVSEDEFHSAEIENIEQKRDYIDKVKENYVMKLSALSASEDFLDDDFETAVEQLAEDIVDRNETEIDREREAKKNEVSEVYKKLSQFVDDNLHGDLSSDDASVESDAEAKISHYHAVDASMEQCNKNHYVNTDKTDSNTTIDESTEGSSQLQPSNKKTLWQRRHSKLDIIIPPTGGDLSQDTSDQRNYKQYFEIPTPDLFDLPTEANKVDNIRNEQENYSQNNSEDIFSRPTQENTKIDQRSQSSQQNFSMLSLAVNVGISQCQYSENVAVAKPVIESQEVYESDKNSKETSNMIDLTLNGDEAEIMKEVQNKTDVLGKVTTNEVQLVDPVTESYEFAKRSSKQRKDNIIDLTLDGDDAENIQDVQHKTDLVAKVTTNEPRLITPVLLAANVAISECQYFENVAVVESDKKSSEKSKDNIIDLTVDEGDAEIMKEVLHKMDLIEKAATNEPLLNTPELFGILASSGSEAAGAESLTHGPKRGTSLKDKAVQEANLTVKKKPRTLVRTGKKQFRLEDLSEDPDTMKKIEQKLGTDNNKAGDKVVVIESGMKQIEVAIGTSKDPEKKLSDKPAEDEAAVCVEINDANDQSKDGGGESSESDIEWAPEMNADNMDFIETFDKIREMEEHKTAAPVHSEEKTAEGISNAIDTEMLLKNLDQDKSLTQLSGVSDFIRKKPVKRIISSTDSEVSKADEEPLLKNSETKENIENYSEVANLKNFKDGPELYVKISKVIKKPKELKKKKTRPPLEEISHVELEQRVHGKTGNLHVTAQEASATRIEAVRVDEKSVSQNNRDAAGDEIFKKVIEKPKEFKRKKREKTRPLLKEIRQVKLEKHIHGEAGEIHVAAQEEGYQAPHATQNEAAPVSRNDKDGTGAEIAENETEKSKNILVGAETPKEVAPSSHKQDENVEATVREAELVTDASSDRQVVISLVGREKRDSSPEAVHHQTIITTAQVHNFEIAQQTDAKLTQKSAQLPECDKLLAKENSTAAKLVESPAIQPVQHRNPPISEIANMIDSPTNFTVSPDIDFGQAPNFPALMQNATINKADDMNLPKNVSQDLDLVPRKRSPILTRNRSKEPVTVKSPDDVILENNDLFDRIEVETSKAGGSKKLWRPGSYSYLDDLLDGEMKSIDSDSLPVPIEKGTKIPKQKKPRTKKKREEVEPSEKKKKEKTPRKSAKPVDESSKEGVKKRRPRKRKEFSLSTTNFKSLDELFDMTCRDLANRPWGYNYPAQNKSILNTPVDIVVRSAPRNSSSDESPELTKFIDKKEPSPEQPGPQSSEYSWPELEVVPMNTNAAQPRVKINILQDIIIKPKRASPDEASSPVSKKPKLNVIEHVDEVALPAMPEVVEHNVQNVIQDAGTGEDVMPNLLNTLQFIINLLEARNNPNSIQKLKQISSYIDQLKN